MTIFDHYNKCMAWLRRIEHLTQSAHTGDDLLAIDAQRREAETELAAVRGELDWQIAAIPQGDIRCAMSMRYLSGEQIADIAVEMCHSESYIKSLLNSGRKAIIKARKEPP